MTLRAVSLFSNCGAGDLGYARAGFVFDVMAELEQRRLDVALLNHPNAVGVAGDLRGTLPAAMRAFRQRAGRWARPALLAACPPCQGLSSARSDRGKEADADAGSRDPRNLLVSVIERAVRDLRPRVVVVENVPAFLRRKVRHPATKQPVSAAAYLVDALSQRYEAFAMVADLADYGVPQHRTRAFLTFIDRVEPCLDDLVDGNETPFPSPTHVGRHISVEAFLRGLHLPRLDAKSAKRARSEMPLHFVPVLDAERYAMVAATPAHGSAWSNNRCRSCGPVDAGRDEAACRSCGGPLLRPMVATEDGGFRLITGFRSSSYTRMDGRRPASTITTASGSLGSDRTVHPRENRTLSPLECARLQTIPEDFNWGATLERYGHTNLRAMIGEAVPPQFTHLHGRLIARLLSGKRPGPTLPAGDRRVMSAMKALASERARLR